MTDVGNPEESNSSSARLLHASSAALFFLLVAVVTSRLFLSESLWLDEGITWWVSKDGPAEAWRRAITYQGQSPLYYIIESLLFSFEPSPSEFLLRLPSILFLTIGIYFSFKSLKSLSFTYAPAFVGIATLVSSPLIARMCSARPYALAFCCLSISICYWIRFLTNKGRLNFIVALSFGVLTIYAHYFFAFGLIAWWLLTLVGGSMRYPLGATLLTGMLTVPFLLRQMLSLANRAQSISAFSIPTLKDLFSHLLLMPTAIAIIIAVTVTLVIDANAKLFEKQRVLRRLYILFGLWIGMVLVFWGANVVTGASLFLDRYFSWGIILWALAAAILCESFREVKSRMIFLALFFGMLILSESQRHWMVEEWANGSKIIADTIARSEIELVHGRPAILIAPGLAEAEDPAWYLGEEGDYLRSITSYYGISVEDTWLVPKTLTNREYIEAHIFPLFGERSEVLFMYLAPLTSEYKQYLFGYATQQGFLVDELQSGLVRVARFVRIA